MFKALVVDQDALPILDSAIVDDRWFENFDVPENQDRLRQIVLNGVVYIFSNGADEGSGFVVVNTGKSGIFSGHSSKRTVLERILRMGMRHHDRSVVLPRQWYRYNSDSRISIFSEAFSSGNYERLIFEQSPSSTNYLYCAGIGCNDDDLSDITIDLRPFNQAVDGILDALLAAPKPKSGEAKVGNFGILLSAPLGEQLATQGTLDEWYDHRLNDDQVSFVNCGLDAPARLRGVAGSGKTQAMAVKCLRELKADELAGGDKTFAFLTHSTQLAHEVVTGMFSAMDPSKDWSRAKTRSGQKKLWIGTIYELALEKLNYERSGIKPLDTDGRNGREYQKILVKDALDQTMCDPQIALGPLKVAEEITARYSDPEAVEGLVADVLSEFSCVMDAEKVRKGTATGDKYLAGRREAWQMSLHTPSSREILLEAYTQYRALLRQNRRLSLDQMIVDFDQYLLSYEWNELREVDGFDAIFVDEYHYFSRVETMALQHLFKPRSEVNGKLPLFMAYDLKQGVSEVGLGVGVERFRNPGVGKTNPIDLKTVYRSSPEITEFLVDIDGAFPSLDLEGEYKTYEANSDNENGDVPRLYVCDNNIDLIDEAMKLGVKIAKKSKNGGRDVAILCMNEKLFDLYRKAGRNEGKFVPMISRGDLRQLRYAKNRCVFSMPEYVAGLQFDSVILIHVDEADLATEYPSQGERRRFVSRLYLGASRAQKELHVFASKERQGPSKILQAPLSRGTLQHS